MTSLSSYINRGWRLIPCHNIETTGLCSCGNSSCSAAGKHPRTKNGIKDASSDPTVVREWWDRWPKANWALACGADSGVVVIDIDERNGGYTEFDKWEQHNLDDGIPDTLRANTGGGGQHLFFKYPDSGTVGNRVNWLPGVDVRGEGGYVILPPSNHISGGRYEWRGQFDTELANVPQNLLQAIAPGGGGGLGASPLPDTDDLLAGIPEGSRDEKEALIKVEQAFKQDHSDDDFFDDDEDGEDPILATTDMGNSDRLARQYRGKYKYVTNWGWMVWTDLGWSSISEHKVLEDAKIISAMIRAEVPRLAIDPIRQNVHRRWARESESRGRLTSAVSLARGDSVFAAEPEQFDADPELLACRNGMVNLRDGSIRPFRTDDLFTKNTEVMYDPHYVQPEWEKFLRSATNDDEAMIEYLQLAAGYTLTGLTSEECFFIISGPTGTGKSTFIEGMTKAMGQYTSTANAETFMKRAGRDPERDEVAKFPGARMISTSELPEGERFNDAFLKKITGGDTLSARKLYQESFDFAPQFKIWMATNHDPITSDSAMFRRIKRLPFTHSIPESKRDPNLKKIITDRELGSKAILAWAVAGAVKYLAAGRLITPTTVELSTGAYQQEQDVFTAFLQEVYVRKDGAKQKLAEVGARHTLWASDNNDRKLRRPQLVAKLKDAGLVVTDHSNENRDRMVLGIELREQAAVLYS